MGFHSYICLVCNSNIRFNGFQGEEVVLKHLRHGEVIDEVRGIFNGYGGVMDADFWNDETHKSVHRLYDSGQEGGSGVQAYHAACYNEYGHKRDDKRVSPGDPSQGLGEIREGFM